ncbi:hypothetical protein RFI_02008 [Reticulomyxa filosa]|uniref:Uncharacterized protein n=1 Tax=Reticulomyxa filosa TaxID=46433 RepID=X6PBL1_RETFI|nr:hypothetical protein RFI_02008 [Reticulomyxa filosa]|eukprot:ETO35067.1 hypothetical protein RFI_02008 [Reticulomyxa filosa]
MTTQSSNQNSKVDENEVKNENKSENTNAHRNLSSSPPSVDPLVAFRMWCDVRLQLLIGITFYSGLSQAFEFGEFPTLIKNNSLKFYTLSIFGLTNSLFSYIFGYISDSWGRLPVLLMAIGSHAMVKPETFANFKFFQSLASTWGFIWHIYVSFSTKLITYFLILFVATVILFSSSQVRNSLKAVSSSSKYEKRNTDNIQFIRFLSHIFLM